MPSERVATRADLAAVKTGIDAGTLDRAAAVKILGHWQQDPDLARVRDPQRIDELPEDERARWRGLWQNVDEALRRALERPAEGGHPSSPPSPSPSCSS